MSADEKRNEQVEEELNEAAQAEQADAEPEAGEAGQEGSELDALKAKLQEYQDQALRSQAEMQNVRRRAEIDVGRQPGEGRGKHGRAGRRQRTGGFYSRRRGNDPQPVHEQPEEIQRGGGGAEGLSAERPCCSSGHGCSGKSRKLIKKGAAGA